MRYIREGMYFIIAFCCSKFFFNSSLLAMSFIFVGLNCIGKRADENFQENVKKRKLLVVCSLLGLTFIILGRFFCHVDGLIILGAMIFAPTLSVLVVTYIYKIIMMLKNRSH